MGAVYTLPQCAGGETPEAVAQIEQCVADGDTWIFEMAPRSADMKAKTYLRLCGGLTLVWVLGLLFVLPFAQLIEQLMLLFLSTNAR